MKDHGSRAKCMAKESMNGKIILDIKAIMWMEKNKVLERLSMFQGKFTKVIGIMATNMDLECSSTKKVKKPKGVSGSKVPSQLP